MGLVCILKKQLIAIYFAFLSTSALCVLYLNSGHGKVCLISLEEFVFKSGFIVIPIFLKMKNDFLDVRIVR